MLNGGMVSLMIEQLSVGVARLRVVVVRDGAVEEKDEVTGPVDHVRSLARSMAADHDLVPIWEDSSWIVGDSRRPPADRYEHRNAS